MAMRIEKLQMKLSYDGGEKDGKQIYKNKTYSNIKEDATDENIKTAATIIAEFSERELLTTRKIETSIIE